MLTEQRKIDGMKRAFSKKNLWENLPQAIKGTIGKVAGLVSPEYLLGKQYRQWARLVDQADKWSPDQIKDYQLLQLRKITQLAYDKSSYYRKCFDEVGFDITLQNGFIELEKLPLIDKQVINKYSSELITVPEDTPGVDYVSTGGSSGEPLRFLIGADRSAIEFAHLASSWFRTGYQLSTPQAVFRGQLIKADSNGLRHFYDPLLRRHQYSSFHMDDVSVKRCLTHISSIGPCYLHVYPSTMNLIVRYLNRHGVKPPANIRGLLVGSENVYEQDREAAESLFGLRYYSWYGHSEKLVMAAECEHSNSYHVFPTYGYCELVDEQGKVITTPGESGEIVGTGYINQVMPFIRYRTGDYATYVGDHCELCGRHQMILKGIRGHRTLEHLVAKDRSLIPWAAVNVHDDTFEQVQQFQFVQFEVGKAILKLVPAGAPGSVNIAKIKADLAVRLQERLDFDVEIVDEIKLTARGKSIFVDQNIDIKKIMTEG